MKFFICLAVLLAIAYARPQTQAESDAYSAYLAHQNEAARYEFNQNIDDKISDSTNQRAEKREGLAVSGMYSYSDGYHKRTVHYVADQNGYRVTGMEAVPLSDGPKIDLTGTASVSKAAHGSSVMYSVRGVPGGHTEDIF